MAVRPADTGVGRVYRRPRHAPRAASRPDRGRGRAAASGAAAAVPGGVRRFWRLAWDANITGLASMLAYNMLLGVIPIALLGLFVAGQVLSSHAVAQSVLTDLREVFPGSA